MEKHEGRKNNKLLMSIVATIASFVLSIALTIIAYLIGSYFGVFNKTLVIDAMNKSSYYEDVNKYSYNEALDYAIPSNLDPVIFNDVYSLQNTYREGKAYLIASLNGYSYEIDTSYLKEKLHNNINQYINDKNIPEENINQESIDTFVNTIASNYSKNLSVPFLYYYNAVKKIFRQLIFVLIPVLLLISALSVFIIMRSNKWTHKNLRYISYSLLATGIMTSLLPICLFITKLHERLNISPVYFSKLLARYLNASLTIYIAVSLFFFIAGSIMILITYYKRRQVLRK